MKHSAWAYMLALAASLAAPAQAQNQGIIANFQGRCINIDFNTNCAFDARLPVSRPSGCGLLTVAPVYVWDFSDGSARVITRSPVIEHRFGNVDAANRAVRLTVHCGAVSSTPLVRQICSGGIGIPGCIFVNNTWN
jgi:hypothetical protein